MHPITERRAATRRASGTPGPRRRLIWRAVAGIAALAFLVGGCGIPGFGASGEASGGQRVTELPPAQAIAQAAEKIEGAGTARFDVLTNVGVAGTGHTAVVSATGQLDLAKDLALMDVDGVAPSGDRKAFRVVTADGKGYARFTQGTEWARFDAADAERLDLGPFRIDIARHVALTHEVRGARRGGRQLVQGVQTTQYSGTVDVEAVVATLGGADHRREFLASYEDMSVTEMPITVFVTDDGLIAKAVIETTLSPTLESDKSEVSIKMAATFSGWGNPVTIQVPEDAVSAKDIGFTG